MTRHSETSKHIERVAKDPVLPCVGQLTIHEALSGKVVSDQKEQDERDETQEIEIDITRVQRMKLGRTKGHYYAAHGIGKTYQDETVRLLKECDAFSTGFDESEVNKTSEHEILVKLSHPVSGIELRHYRMIDLEETLRGKETTMDLLSRKKREEDLNTKKILFESKVWH